MVRWQLPVRRSQTLIVVSALPLSTTCLSRQTSRARIPFVWPLSVEIRRPVAMSVSFTVWSSEAESSFPGCRARLVTASEWCEMVRPGRKRPVRGHERTVLSLHPAHSVLAWLSSLKHVTTAGALYDVFSLGLSTAQILRRRSSADVIARSPLQTESVMAAL